ncbi:MAG: TetR family transcriptional regulator [Oceanospirillaceae bacterium]|mgnify:FL=1|nr:TetR family transcriptional regulator [Thalassolituus sp.]MAX99156.1 TetR family transcriptional regulator [Oceanospirillaceae bacterium]
MDKPQKKQNLAPRNAPVQGRSRERSRQILDATSELLEKVGFDDLNTILIARAVGISVGSLYHYYPNKHAILFAMGSRWLEEVEAALDSIALWPIEEMDREELVDKMLAANLKAYKQQKAILTLVQAMFAVPELRELDERHDEMYISRMAEVFKRMGSKAHIRERERMGRMYLEITHAACLVIVHQKGQRAQRTLDDLKLMVITFLNCHIS